MTTAGDSREDRTQDLGNPDDEETLEFRMAQTIAEGPDEDQSGSAAESVRLTGGADTLDDPGDGRVRVSGLALQGSTATEDAGLELLEKSPRGPSLGEQAGALGAETAARETPDDASRRVEEPEVPLAGDSARVALAETSDDPAGAARRAEDPFSGADLGETSDDPSGAAHRAQAPFIGAELGETSDDPVGAARRAEDPFIGAELDETSDDPSGAARRAQAPFIGAELGETSDGPSGAAHRAAAPFIGAELGETSDDQVEPDQRAVDEVPLNVGATRDDESTGLTELDALFGPDAAIDVRSATLDEGGETKSATSLSFQDVTLDDALHSGATIDADDAVPRLLGAGAGQTRTDDGDEADFSRVGETAIDFAGYQLIERVAEGGMGVVFKARQTGLKRIVAVKIMKGGALASDYRRKRFVQEAEAAAALKHLNIVPIHEISESGGHPYYVMDFVAGKPIHDTVRAEGLSVEEIARYMSLVADAVHHFHTRGIIHRDLKSDNILVDLEARLPKIIDFGIAKNLTGEDKKITREGAVLGTPHYMPPEQASGSHSDVDTRSDVYALGAILYELLTGGVPFGDVDAKMLLFTILDKDPAAPDQLDPEVPWELSAITLKAMEKTRERRYQTALEFKDDVERFLNNEPIEARPATLYYRSAKMVARHTGAFVAAAFVVAIVTGLISLIITREYAAQRRDVSSAKAQTELANKAREESERAAEEARRATGEANRAKALAEDNQKLEAARRAAAERAATQLKKAQFEAEEARKARQEAANAADAARAKQLAERHDKVRGFIARPRDDALVAVNNLTQALVLVGDTSQALRSQAERAKLSLVLELSQQAVAEKQPVFASFWLDQGRVLTMAMTDPEQRARLEALERRIDQQRRGLDILGKVRQHLEAGELFFARSELERALAGGARSEDLGDLEQRVGEACKREAVKFVTKARQAYKSEDHGKALEFASLALGFDPGEGVALSMRDEAAGRLAERAQRVAASLSLSPGSRERALELLEVAVKRLVGTPAAVDVARELRLRRVLLAPGYESLLYVPACAALKTNDVYIQRQEVTQQQYQRFIDAQGYADDRYWRGGSLTVEQRETLARQRRDRRVDPADRRRPALGLSYDEACAYAAWLSAQRGARYRLPSAEEWTVAAGWDFEASELRLYPWGDRFTEGALAVDLERPRSVDANPRDRSSYGMRGAGGGIAEWVGGSAPGVKGADYFCSGDDARRFARVQMIRRPARAPRLEVVARIGMRLVREVEP